MAGLSLLLGIALLVLAVPRTIAAWAGLDAQPALHEVNRAQTPKPDDVVAGIAGLKRAIEWVPSARRFIDLATLEFELGLSLPADDARRQEAFESAQAHFIEGLSLNPVDGLAWLRLAWVREGLKQPARSVAVCLVQSLDMAPHMRPLWLARARMLLVYWSSMTVEEVLTVRRQLQTIWSAEPGMRRPLVQMAQEVSQLVTLYWALGEDPEVRAEFTRIVAALPQR